MRFLDIVLKIRHHTKALIAAMLLIPALSVSGMANASLIWDLELESAAGQLDGVLSLEFSQETGDSASDTEFSYLFTGSIFDNLATLEGDQSSATDYSWEIDLSTPTLISFMLETPFQSIAPDLFADLLVEFDFNSNKADSLCRDDTNSRCNGGSLSLTEQATVTASAAQAVPEPATALLLGIGVFGFVASRRKVA